MWLKLLVSLLLVQYLNAVCDVCQTGKAACHSKNTYSICINDVPTYNVITCPDGYTCTGDKFICYPEEDGYEPICNPEDSITSDTTTTIESTTPTTTTPTTTTPTTTTPTTTTPTTTTPTTTTPTTTTPTTTTPTTTTPTTTTPTTTTPTTTTPTTTTPTTTTPTTTTPTTTTPTTTTPTTTTPTTTTPTTTTPTTTTSTTTTTAESTTSSSSTTVDTDYKTFCTANGNGNFTNDDDPTCTTYILCYRNKGAVKDCEIVNDKQGYFDGTECVYTKPATCT
ncbi:salivary glue protein Sgs-3 [Drosophila albomicans]|uniref:Salivary glue protein Sgs-3 n=1 Tax=Drosophila albomicans TaxID=7291 RepID=A0A9C6WEW3_DROAB|nr:salivary glue protein Sgs-3 [Drosophila albomicans]